MAKAIRTATLREEGYHRTFGAAGNETGWGCGFIRKPETGGYTNREHFDYICVYVLRGSGTFTANGQSHSVQAGSFCQHVPAGVHSLQPHYDGQWAEVFLVMDGPLYSRMADLGAIDRTRPVLDPGLDSGLVERFEQILSNLRELPDASLPRMISRCVDLLVYAQHLDRSGRDDPVQADLVDRACRRLADEATARQPLPHLARDLGVSYDHFRKIFAARTGVSPGEYRIRHRIDRARELIMHQGLSNKEIADALGYPDPFSFSKQFKRVAGESPDHFRQRMYG